MDEFKNNKDGKIDELKVWDTLYRFLAMHCDWLSQLVGWYLQTKGCSSKACRRGEDSTKRATDGYSRVGCVSKSIIQTCAQPRSPAIEQNEKDIEASRETLNEAKTAIVKLHKELGKLQEQLKVSEVRNSSSSFEARGWSKACYRGDQAAHLEAEGKLKEERATLTRFDDELKALDRVIKEKKKAAVDAELELKKLEHDMQTLAKEKAAAAHLVDNLEKQYEWIAEEHE